VTSLPRATCPHCGKSVPVRRNGMLREHYVYRPQQEQVNTSHLGRMETCAGSGGPPLRWLA
jgi:hypothetical protein